MTNLFSNRVILRGYLVCDGEAPPSYQINEHSYATLTLATVSGVWDIEARQWRSPRIDWHRVICLGPFFCGMVRGMKRREYLEIEGELRDLVKNYTVTIAGQPAQTSCSFYAVHATRITRLERPEGLVDSSEPADTENG